MVILMPYFALIVAPEYIMETVIGTSSSEAKQAQS